MTPTLNAAMLFWLKEQWLAEGSDEIASHDDEARIYAMFFVAVKEAPFLFAGAFSFPPQLIAGVFLV